ncbi:unnamed protein product [Heterobilharzia americana]|nr:unnamed protein product [Heterobilharzia americana]
MAGGSSSSPVMQQRRLSVKLYTEFSQNYPAIRNLPVQIDDSSHSMRSISVPTGFQSTAMQTVNQAPEVSVQVDLLTRTQSEVIQTDPEMDFDTYTTPTLVDAAVESISQPEQPVDPMNSLRVYLLNQLPISVYLKSQVLKS